MTLDAFVLSSGGGAIIALVGREIVAKFTTPKNGNTPVTKHDCQVTMEALDERLTLGDDRFNRIEENSMRIEEKIDKILMRL